MSENGVRFMVLVSGAYVIGIRLKS